jgi:hypothetical protein
LGILFFSKEIQTLSTAGDQQKNFRLGAACARGMPTAAQLYQYAQRLTGYTPPRTYPLIEHEPKQRSPDVDARVAKGWQQLGDYLRKNPAESDPESQPALDPEA